jgi:dihydroneopterin aldolase
MIELSLNGLEVRCIIGDLPEERTVEQDLAVDVVIEIDSAAEDTDELVDTVDYAELAGAIRRTLADAKCRMIERAAKIVAQQCMRHRRVASATVTITKSGAIDGLKSASARITIRREGRS